MENFFNPAHLGKTDDIVINANYHKQLFKLEESPNVQSIGLHSISFDRVGGGLSFRPKWFYFNLMVLV